MRPEEVGRIVGPSSEPARVGGSTIVPEVPSEGRVALPPRLKS